MASSASQRQRIVVVEDEPDFGTLLEYVLGREGFDVTVARSGEQALEALRGGLPDLILLDRMLPDMDGLEILQAARQSAGGRRTRIVILSARCEEADRIRGLELGADDYVVKPFSPRELVLRVRALLQRDAAPAAPRDERRSLAAGPIELDLEYHEARVSGRLVHLTLTEFRLLAALVRNEGRVRSRDALLAEVWGYDAEAMTRTVDTHVRRLRSKLGDAAAWLATVRGVGYRVRDPRLD